ncbi:MAG: hypothetical protein Q9157_000223 [Trypethelium eluteriae]
MPALLSVRDNGPPPLPSSYVEYSNASGILAIVGTLTALALLVVLLRIYVRACMLKVFGIDDHLMVLAMLLSCMLLVCFVEETKNGLGRHFIWNWVHAILFVLSNSTLKISVAFFLMRITARTHYHRFLWGVVIFIILFTIACFGTLLFQCIPVSAAWDSSLRPPPFGHGTAKCYSLTIFRDIGVFNSSIMMATDVLFASLPVPLIWSLQLNKRQKISLICALGLGFFSCAASLVKTVLQFNFLKNKDWTVHDSFDVWASVEVNVGILAASLPALKPLLNGMLEPVKRALTGSSKLPGLDSKGSSNRSRKASSMFGVRVINGRSASSLGYLKHSSDKDIPMNLLPSETIHANHRGSFCEGPKGGFGVGVSSGELYPSHRTEIASTSDDRREYGGGVTWLNYAAQGSDDNLNYSQPSGASGKNGIMKTTEVRLT